VDKRPRLSPTDPEFARFMACPDVPEHIHLMALSSRAFGGQRTSDLHAWDWRHVDTENFAVAEVYRPKTDGDEDAAPGILETLIIPGVLRGPLMAWWTRWGRRTEGPVFPVMRGKRAGERQGKRSHAKALRRAFWMAGAHRSLPGFEDAVKRLRAAEQRLAELSRGGEGREVFRAALIELRVATEAAKALDAMQTDTPQTKCLDFHSLRRSYNTALARAGLNVQQSMALAGHKNASTHMRYVQLAQHGPLEQPANALPLLIGPPSPAANDGISGSDGARIPAGSELSAGDPTGVRTPVTGVRGRCPNH
jgi:integrase